MNGSTQLQMASETLSDNELATITGYKTPSFQRQWLIRNAWEYVLTGAQRPVVGRVYARLKLAGVKPSATNAVAETWTLDLSRVS
jgi:bacteriocin-like protein